MKALLAVTALLLMGCSEMTREQIIAARKQCLDAGMRPAMVGNAWTYGIFKVNCIEMEGKE